MTLTDIMSQLPPEPDLPEPTQTAAQQNPEVTIEPALDLSVPEHQPPQTTKRTIVKPKRLIEEM